MRYVLCIFLSLACGLSFAQNDSSDLRPRLVLHSDLRLAFQTSSAPAPKDHPFHWPDGKKVAVSLSFDDARDSQMDVGLPLFDRHHAKVTFYVNPPNMKNRLAAWKQTAAKGYEIGNHTMSHPCTGNFTWVGKNDLEDYTMAKMEHEIDQANAETLSLLGVKPTTFAYPCGQKFIGRGTGTQSYVPLVARKFRVGRGFRDEAANNPEFCDFAQVLSPQSDEMSFEEMKKWVLTAAENGGWLIFTGHEIGKPGFQVTNVDVLDQFLNYAADPSNGVWPDTVDAVARYIQQQRGH